jgi:acetylornithine deacetylase/succinyl-diaminopimelate desuccinylase-like protein
MARLARANAREIAGIDPTPVISLGGTDTQLWRYKDIPAIVYGPSPIGMGSVDEHVTVEEFPRRQMPRLVSLRLREPARIIDDPRNLSQ